MILLDYSRDIPKGVTAEKIELYREDIMKTRRALDLIEAAWSDWTEKTADTEVPSSRRGRS